jgi:hypothetical protein
MCEDFASNSGDELLLHHDNAPSHTSFFTRDYFYQKQHDNRPPPNILLSVSQIKNKLKGRQFNTTEMMEPESQAVLNTLTEHDFHAAFKTWQKLWEPLLPVSWWLKLKKLNSMV